MAKSKKGADAPASQADTVRELRKLFGDDCVYSGDRVLDAPPEILSLSPYLDQALGGGLMVGTICTLAGPSGCGKTTTALHAAARWQALGRKVRYGAVEERIWAMNLTGVAGLRPAEIDIIGSSKDHIMSAQDHLLAYEKILRGETNTLLIIDSVSQLCDDAEMTASKPGEGVVGGANRLVASFLRRMAPIIKINEHIVIGIAQVYTNIGGKKKHRVAMPLKMEFGRGTGLECSWAEPVHDGETPVGQLIHWTVVRSPLGPPNAKFKSMLRYGVGIDVLGETVEQARELGLIEKSGSWNVLAFLDEPVKVQGFENVRAHLEANPEHLTKLEERLRYLSS